MIHRNCMMVIKYIVSGTFVFPKTNAWVEQIFTYWSQKVLSSKTNE